LPSRGSALVIITVLVWFWTCASCNTAASLRYCSSDTVLDVPVTNRA
jgi:hypothetical protein